MAHYIPISMNITAQGVAKISWDRVFKDVGLSRKVISNRGPQFMSRFMKELCSQLGVERNPSTAYHPQTDSQTERVNQELEQYLRLYCNYRQNDWAEWLSIAEFSYNNQIYSSTGRSLFLVNLGCHPNTGQDTEKSTEDSPGMEEFLKTIKEIRNRVEEALKKTNEMMKKKWDAKKKSEIERKSGDLVWVDATHYSTDQPSRKLSTKRLCKGDRSGAPGDSSVKL